MEWQADRGDWSRKRILEAAGIETIELMRVRLRTAALASAVEGGFLTSIED